MVYLVLTHLKQHDAVYLCMLFMHMYVYSYVHNIPCLYIYVLYVSNIKLAGRIIPSYMFMAKIKQ